MGNHYNLLYQENERELIPICKQMGVSLIPYSPLAAGHLTRPEWTTDTLRSRTDRVAMGKYDRTKDQDLEIVHRVHTLAERYGVKMQQIALAWHWAKGVASPIIGATKAAHFDDAAAALNVRRKMWPIRSSRICPTRSWAPSTRTRYSAGRKEISPLHSAIQNKKTPWYIGRLNRLLCHGVFQVRVTFPALPDSPTRPGSRP